ncbi:MAG: DUF167 domain-containing protein [Magnetospiraceae bacterium]
MPFRQQDAGLQLLIRVTPRANKNKINGLRVGGDGRTRLLVSVTAPPEGGKANAAVIKLLAKTWRLPKTAISVLAGATDRDKTLLLEAVGEAPTALEQRLRHWIEATYGHGDDH